VHRITMEYLNNMHEHIDQGLPRVIVRKG